MNILTSDTAVGRAVRVLAYTVVTGLVAFLANPDVVKAIANQWPQLSILVVLLPPVLSAVVNALRSDVQNS